MEKLLKDAADSYDFTKGFFQPTRAEMLDESPLRNFGILFGVSLHQYLHVYDWPGGKFDPVTYFVHFFLGVVFSVQGSKKMSKDLKIDRIFWRMDANYKLKIFLVSSLEESKGKVTMKCFNFNRNGNIEKPHDWRDEDFADIASKLGGDVKLYQFESHHYDIEYKRDMAKSTNVLTEHQVDVLGIFVKTLYEPSVKIKPRLVKLGQRKASSTRLHTVPPFVSESDHSRSTEDFLDGMFLYPEKMESTKSHVHDFTKHLITTFKQTFKSNSIKSALPEAHCGFIHGHLFPFTKTYNFFPEVAQYVSDRPTAQFNIFVQKKFTSNWKHIIYEYPFTFHVVDTSLNMPKLDIEKRIIQVIVEHAKKKELAARRTFADKMLVTYVNFNADDEKRFLKQHELPISTMPFCDVSKSMPEMANMLKNMDMNDEQKVKDMDGAAAYLNYQFQHEILIEKLMKNNLCTENSRCLSRYIHGQLASSSSNSYVAKYNGETEYEKNHRTNFIFETGSPDLHVMLTIHEDEDISSDSVTQVLKNERNLPFPNEKSKFMMCTHVFVSYNPAQDTGAAGRALSQIETHSNLLPTTRNSDYSLEPIIKFNLKFHLAKLKTFPGNRNLVTEIKRFIEGKLTLFKSYQDFAAFSLGNFHQLQSIMNIVASGPNTVQIGYIALRGDEKMLTLANFIYGKSSEVKNSLDALAELYDETVKRKSSNMASIVALALIENPETKTLDTVIFDEHHLAGINMCKRMKRLRRSTCNAYEDLERLQLKSEESPRRKTVTVNDKMLFVHRLGKISSGIMSGMMAKSLIVDAIEGNLVGVAINTGFLLSNLVVSAASVKIMTRGAELAEEGKIFLGSILKLSGPFLARCPSFFFVGYDLYKHLHSNESNSENSVAIGTDAAYITLDLAESAIEMAEIVAGVEGISAITGPIGWTVGAVLLISSDVYRAVKQVEKINTVIPLTTVEIVCEGIRGFIGLNPSSKVMSLIRDEQEHAKVVQELLKTMSEEESMVKRYVSPLKMSENCLMDNYMDFTTEKQNFTSLRTLPNLSDEFSYFCSTPDYSYCNGPTITKSVELLFSRKTHAYMCTGAIGIENQNVDSELTYLRLGDGFDKIKAFEHNPNVFEIGNGKKVITGGNEDDIFLVNGNKTTGVLDGGYGHNFLNLAGVKGNFSLFINHKAIVSMDNESELPAMNITFKNIDQVQGRPNAQDFVEAWCFLSKLNTLGGYDEMNLDKITVPYSNCFYELIVIIHSNTLVSNEALYGQFKYHVENLEHGSSSLVIQNYNPIAEHVLSFEYNFYDFASVWTRVDQGFTKIMIVLNNQSNFTINVSSLKNVKLAFRDGVQCQFHGKHIIASLNTTNDLTTVENYYAIIISASTISMVIHSTVTNQTTTLARGERSEGAGASLNIIHSNPDYKSHLKSSFHENVFSVSPYKTKWNNDICVKFHDIDITMTVGKNLIDLTKVRRAVMAHSTDINLTISTNGTHLLVLEVSYMNENTSQSCLETIGTIMIRKTEAVDKISILGKGPMNIKFMQNVAYLEPSPIYFNESENIIVLSDHGIEPNTKIYINKTLGVDHNIYTDNSSILITNIRRDSKPCSFLQTVSTSTVALYIVNFVESRAMQSLIFQFNDLEIKAEQLKYEADKFDEFTKLFDLKECLWSSIMKLPVLVSEALFQ